MTPQELSETLNKIASKIEASISPSRELVLVDLKRIMASLDPNAHEAGLKETFTGLMAGLALLVGAEKAVTYKPDGMKNLQAMHGVGRNAVRNMTSDIARRLGKESELKEYKDHLSDQYGGYGEHAADAAFLATIGVVLEDNRHGEDGELSFRVLKNGEEVMIWNDR